MSRLGRATDSALATLAVVVGVAVLLSVVAIVPSTSSSPAGVALGSGAGGATGVSTAGRHGTTTSPTAAGGSGGRGVAAGRAGGYTGGSTSSGVPAPAPGLACAPGRNGGSTDVGVSATQIKFAATTVTDGPGASFLAPMDVAIQAVTTEVNRSGGICGRRLSVELRNDSWNAALGEQYIEDFVQGSGVFGLAVNPDSEGLYAANSYIRQQGVPVVGTSGMLIDEYLNPWIWPVGTSTISQMDIMAAYAYAQGARTFGIAFDAEYAFGVEGAYAFDQAVKTLTGHNIAGYNSSLNNCSEDFCGVQDNQPSYASQATEFNNSCINAPPPGQHQCQYIAYLMEPSLALAWLSNGRGAANPQYGFGGAQPLFDTQAFADQCGATCQHMQVWTGFQPPIGSFTDQPAEVAYTRLVTGYDPSADVTNQFLEGAYIGMNLLVAALRQVGPDLTRARLRAVLDTMTYSSGLGPALHFGTGDHFADTEAMAWQLNYADGTFTGFSPIVGYQRDPWVGKFIPPGE